MSWRVCLTILILLPGLAGCASNRPLLAPDGPIFGRGGAIVGIGAGLEARPEGHGWGTVADQPQENVTVVEAWGEPLVHPIAYGGPKAVADSDGPYLLDSGDRLRIFVYGQPNLSRTYIVDHAGQIAVPLIGIVHARGLTTVGLASVIRDELGVDYVRDPQVTVDILQHRPFFILGEVRNAGQYPYVSGMTVETAIAIAGGYTERASKRSFRVSRRIDGLVEEIDAPSDYVVKPGDTVFVYERYF